MSGGRRAHALAVALALALGGSGCVSFSGDFGTPIAVEHLPRIRDGVTTRAEIIAWFGPPSAFYNPSFLDVITEDAEDILAPAPVLNDVFTYRYLENDTTIFFVPIFYARVDAAARGETLTVFFDEEGRVKYHAYRRDASKGGD